MLLTQHISFPTRCRAQQTPSLLDLVLTKYPDTIQDIHTRPPFEKLDHLTLVIKVVIGVSEVVSHIEPMRCFNKVRAKDITDAADRIEWTDLYNYKDVEGFWNVFKANIMGITELTVPCVLSRSNRKMPWVTKFVRREHQLGNISLGRTSSSWHAGLLVSVQEAAEPCSSWFPKRRNLSINSVLPSYKEPSPRSCLPTCSTIKGSSTQ